MKLRIATLCLLSSICLLAACSRKQRAEEPVVLPPAAEVEKPAAVEQLTVSAMARGNVIWIGLENHLARPVNVLSSDFAVILPNKQLLRWDPATMKTQLPHTKLEPGQIANGRLQFTTNEKLVGLNLVYNPRPQAEPVVTKIKPYQATVFDKAQ